MAIALTIKVPGCIGFAAAKIPLTKRMILFSISELIDDTKRSTIAFRLGLLDGNRISTLQVGTGVGTKRATASRQVYSATSCPA